MFLFTWHAVMKSLICLFMSFLNTLGALHKIRFVIDSNVFVIIFVIMLNNIPKTSLSIIPLWWSFLTKTFFERTFDIKTTNFIANNSSTLNCSIFKINFQKPVTFLVKTSLNNLLERFPYKMFQCLSLNFDSSSRAFSFPVRETETKTAFSVISHLYWEWKCVQKKI